VQRGFSIGPRHRKQRPNSIHHYVLTLRHCVHRLENRAGHARQVTDESTYRTWRLCTAGSAHFFETGQLNAYQSLLAKAKDGHSGLLLTKTDWYC
jgi:cyclopropane fatty-acyl-phospholipid synthase-like methyltransferase